MLLVHPEYHQMSFSYCMKPAEYQQYMAEISAWIGKSWLVNVVEEQKTEISLEIELTSVNLEEFLASLRTLIMGAGWVADDHLAVPLQKWKKNQIKMGDEWEKNSTCKMQEEKIVFFYHLYFSSRPFPVLTNDCDLMLLMLFSISSLPERHSNVCSHEVLVLIS